MCDPTTLAYIIHEGIHHFPDISPNSKSNTIAQNPQRVACCKYFLPAKPATVTVSRVV